MKLCKTCNTEKSSTEFYRSHLGHYLSDCKLCSRKRSAAWAKANKDRRYNHYKKWRKANHNSIKVKSQQILDGMVARSKHKGFPRPEFTRHEIESIISGGRCQKTAIPFEFDQSVYSKSPWTPVPDRINPKIGYTKKNVQWVCHVYNSAKQEFTDDVVIRFIKAFIANAPGNF
jgi:hypothetical protein